MEEVLQELFWAHFYECLYRSNGTKIHLDAALSGSKYGMELKPTPSNFLRRDGNRFSHLTCQSTVVNT